MKKYLFVVSVVAVVAVVVLMWAPSRAGASKTQQKIQLAVGQATQKISADSESIWCARSWIRYTTKEKTIKIY